MSTREKLLIVKGSTVPKPMQITEGGTAKDCSGLTISLEIKRYDGGQMLTVDTPPTVAWTTQAEGKYEVSGGGALAVGNYYARIGLTNGADEIDWVPNKTKAADFCQVVPVANQG